MLLLLLLLSSGRRGRGCSGGCRRRSRRQILRLVWCVDDVRLAGGGRVRGRRGRLQVVVGVVRRGGRAAGPLLDHNLRQFVIIDFIPLFNSHRAVGR